MSLYGRPARHRYIPCGRWWEQPRFRRPEEKLYFLIANTWQEKIMLSEGLSTWFPDSVATLGIPISAIAGVVFAIILWHRVSQIHVGGGSASARSESGREYLLEEEQRGESEVRYTSSIDTLLGAVRNVTRVVTIRFFFWVWVQIVHRDLWHNSS